MENTASLALEYVRLEEEIEDFDCPHDAEARCDCGPRHDAMYRRARALRKRILSAVGSVTVSARECTCVGFCKGRDGLSARYVCSLEGKPGKVGSGTQPLSEASPDTAQERSAKEELTILDPPAAVQTDPLPKE